MLSVGDTVQIKGCTLKARNLVTSSGNSAFDSLLGGGIANTATVLLEESKSRVYAGTLSKYFIAEGLYQGHDVFAVDIDAGTNSDIFCGIPSRMAESSKPNPPPGMTAGGVPTPDMKIAFRYSNTPQLNSNIGSTLRYDLGNVVKDMSQFTSKRTLSASRSYETCFEELSSLLKSDVYNKAVRSSKKNLLRIVITGLGSPIWEDAENVNVFMTRVHLLLRNSYAVAYVTINSDFFGSTVPRSIECCSDIYARLVAISDEEKKALPSLDKFHGYFHLLRLPRLTSIATFVPPAVDLVFELHRKSFDIKILHLPPAADTKEPPKSQSACSVAVEF